VVPVAFSISANINFLFSYDSILLARKQIFHSKTEAICLHFFPLDRHTTKMCVGDIV
jgi:hypothetical protein